MTAAGAVETAAREAFGRLVAYLSARSGDVAGAEDALGDAFVTAIELWPRTGVPDNPDAWLLTVARRRMIDRARRAGSAAGTVDRLKLAYDEAEAALTNPSAFPDERLKLLFVCAHPAIEASARTPLMLQAVLGLTATRIASVFLVSPAAMTKRLTRAKARIHDAGITFIIPEPGDLAARLDEVLASIYAAFALDWDHAAADSGDGLAQEAIWLARLVVAMLPGEPEAAGLLALMLFSEARRLARRSESGTYVPLGEQDVARWSAPLIDEATAHLRVASAAARPGRYQYEAAIQAVHAARRLAGVTDWPAIALLYEGLVQTSSTIGARVGRAAALCEAGDPAAARAALDAIEPARVAAYQPFWATRAHVLDALGAHADAATDFARAAGLSDDAAVRAYLLGRRAALMS